MTRSDRRDTFEPLRFDSSALPTDQQYPTYASAMSNFSMSRRGEGGFAARALVWRVGNLVITDVCADPIRYERSLARIRGDAIDHVYVNVHRRGRFTLDTGDGPKPGGRGSLAVIDMRQPCCFDVGRISELSVALPRSVILDRLGGTDPHGLIASGGLVGLLERALLGVCESLPRLALADAPVVERMVTDLIVDTVRDALQTSEMRTAREDALLSRIRRHIDQNLGGDLDVGSICHALGISRSSLYRAVGGSGGVVRQIQVRRLRRMRALLADPGETRSIAELARMTGFADKSHFARLFKQTNGLTPGAFRAISPQPVPPSASDTGAAQRFSALIRELN